MQRSGSALARLGGKLFTIEMPGFFKSAGKWLSTVASAAVGAGVVAAGMTYFTSELQDQHSKERAAYYEQAKELRDRQNQALDKFFSEENDKILQASRDYVSDMLAKKPLKQSGDALSSAVFSKVRQAETLKSVFADPEITTEISNYQAALQAYADSIETFKTPLQMKEWSENFSKMQEAAINLRQNLRRKVDTPVAKSPT